MIRQFWQAVRRHGHHRRDWLRAIKRSPTTSKIGWNVRILGQNLVIGQHTIVEDFCVLQTGSSNRADEFINIGDLCRIRYGAQIHAMGGSVVIGDHCSINPYSVLYGTGGLTIGRHVRIAAQTVIVAAMHRFERRDVPIHEQGSSARGIVIEDDVWIGAGARILDGIRIGTGAIVAAGAVVIDDVEPFTIVGGVPARVIRIRGTSMASIETTEEISVS